MSPEREPVDCFVVPEGEDLKDLVVSVGPSHILLGCVNQVAISAETVAAKVIKQLAYFTIVIFIKLFFLPQATDLLCLQTSPHALLFVFHMQNNFYVNKPISDLALFCSVLSKYGLYSPKRGGTSHYKQFLLNTFTFVGYMSRKRFTLLHVSRKSLFSLDKDRSSIEPAENKGSIETNKTALQRAQVFRCTLFVKMLPILRN